MSIEVLTRSGEPDLAFRRFRPQEPSRGSILITHGYGEHQGRYDHVAGAWAERGFNVATYDLRGHGRSSGTRGYVAAFDDYLRDAEALLAHLAQDSGWACRGQPVLFGHSLGGLISIHLAWRGGYRRLALTSPFLGLALEVSPVTKWFGRVMSRCWPRFSLPSNIQGGDVTHDAEIAARYDRDPLGVHRVTARFFTEAERAQREALRLAPGCRFEVYCLAAGDDKIVSLAATQRWIERLGSPKKTCQVVAGAYHEVLNEIERQRYVELLGSEFERWAREPQPS